MHAGDSAKMTYSEVLAEVCKLANWLRGAGVRKGDSVAVYMPMVPQLPITMLACARIGAVHTVVFGGFSAKALGGRIIDSGAKVLLRCYNALALRQCKERKRTFKREKDT
jgi:acetyl-CoA synthetase